MKFINQFDLNNKSYTGGNTGSFRVKEIASELNHQIKPSILDNTLIRQWKVEKTDRENLGECIAAAIVSTLLGKDDVPEVFLVYDPQRKRVQIASKYLVGDHVRTLDDYVSETNVVLPKGKKHFVFVSGKLAKIDKGEFALDGIKCSV